MLCLHEGGGSRQVRLSVLLNSGLSQRQDRYSALDEAVNRHKPDVVVLLGRFLDGNRVHREGRLTLQSCSDHLGCLECDDLYFVRAAEDFRSWPHFVQLLGLRDWNLWLLEGGSLKFKQLVVLGFPSACISNEDPHRVTRYHNWIWLSHKVYLAAARTLWLIPDPPKIVGDNLPESLPQWEQAFRKYLPKFVVFGSSPSEGKQT